MSLDLFLQEAKLNQTKPDLKVRNIYRDGKFIVKYSCSSILIDRIELVYPTLLSSLFGSVRLF
jgi:hypothetical protein